MYVYILHVFKLLLYTQHRRETSGVMQDFFFLKRLHLNYLSKMDLVLPKNGNKAIEKPFFLKSLSQTVSQSVST